jgi:transposase
MVVARVKDREKRIREKKGEDQRRDKQRLADQKREERERQREQDRADQEAQRKHREKEREFNKINKLPRSERDGRLAELARRFGEDPAVLREEFQEFTGGGVILGDLTPETPTTWNVVPWDEPVDAALLLQELNGQISKCCARQLSTWSP